MTRPAQIIVGPNTPRRLIAVAICLLGAQWIHAVSQFGGPAMADFFNRWVYDAIILLSGLACVARGFTSADRPGLLGRYSASVCSRSVSAT